MQAEFPMRVFGTIAMLGAVTVFSWPWLRRMVPDLPTLAFDRFLLASACLAAGLVLFFIASRTE